MAARIRGALLLVALAVLAACGVASAGDAQPQDCTSGFDPPQPICTYPPFIDLVGARDGVPDPYGAFTVTVRDAGGNPVMGCSVSILIQCSDVTICAPAPTIAGQAPSCGPYGHATVVAFTDANGVASFNIVGASNNTGGSPGCGAGGAVIRTASDTYVIGTATVTTFDQNGASGGPGVNSGDLGLWLRDFGQQATIGYRGRSDYSHDGSINSADLSVWLRVFGRQDSRDGCAGSYCP
jgi:hypothetical protein